MIADPRSLFHDALQLATRCAALAHQYSTSPLYWYIRKICETSSCAFLALVLASDLPVSHDATNAAWAVLDQLFIPDNGGHLVNAGQKSNLIAKILRKARAKRNIRVQVPMTPQFRDHRIQATTGDYPVQVAQYPPVSSAPHIEDAAVFHPSDNLLEDWEALMQEPIWPAGVSVTDQNYWV